MPNLTAALCNFGCNQLPTGFATELADNPQNDEAGPELAAEHSQIHISGVKSLGIRVTRNKEQEYSGVAGMADGN